MKTFSKFHGLAAMALLNNKILEIDEHGILSIPNGVHPDEFRLLIFVPEMARVTLARKDVGTTNGEYLPLLEDGMRGGYTVYSLPKPIEVRRINNKVWTSWHQKHPNRVDCWYLGETGRLALFQIGIVTHDNGKTFRILGDFRWEGQLFQNGIAKPRTGFQKFTTWEPIFEDPGYGELLTTAELKKWSGSPEELVPPLDEIPEGNARVNWYVPFAGEAGQGICILTNGTSAWIHGTEILCDLDEDGVKRLARNTLISFEEIEYNWGSKDGPPRLLRVKVID